MNVFAVDPCPEVSARSLCDQHVIKMILESAQMLSTVIRHLTPEATIASSFPRIYKSTHANHPCTVWVRSRANFLWLHRHAIALCSEYEFRFGKTHATKPILEEIESKLEHIPFLLTESSPFAIAIAPSILDSCLTYDSNGVLDAHRTYQAYIRGHKRVFGTKRVRNAKWTRRESPDWFE